jgi:flagellar protein FlaG
MQLNGLNGANYTNSSDNWAMATQNAAITSVSADAKKAEVKQSDTAVNGVTGGKKKETLKNTKEKPKEQEVKDNKVLQADNTKLIFKKHKGTGQIMIQIVDNNTGKIVREVPPEKILDSIAQIWKNVGYNVDKKV